MSILIGSVKLYLKLEDAAEELVTEVLRMATDESDNPDLRNRGYVYWRMLSEDPDSAKSVIICSKPTIKHEQGSLDPKVCDQLLANLGYLSSTYFKLPE
jgi:AP-1 complex subunit beta-1